MIQSPQILGIVHDPCSSRSEQKSGDRSPLESHGLTALLSMPDGSFSVVSEGFISMLNSALHTKKKHHPDPLTLLDDSHICTRAQFEATVGTNAEAFFAQLVGNQISGTWVVACSERTDFGANGRMPLFDKALDSLRQLPPLGEAPVFILPPGTAGVRKLWLPDHSLKLVEGPYEVNTQLSQWMNQVDSRRKVKPLPASTVLKNGEIKNLSAEELAATARLAGRVELLSLEAFTAQLQRCVGMTLPEIFEAAQLPSPLSR